MTETPEPDDRALREPFPWMSRTTHSGPYRFTLRSPTSEAVMGSFLILTGVFFLAALVAGPSAPARAVGILMFAVTVGPGVLLVIMAVARARWIRAYTRVNGHSPPY